MRAARRAAFAGRYPVRPNRPASSATAGPATGVPPQQAAIRGPAERWRPEGGGNAAGEAVVAAILLVEDDPDIGGFLSRGFAAEGYDVQCVETGPDAVDAIGRRPFDAVILDIMLPGLSGLDVCRTLRQSGFASPISMLSARCGVPDRVEGLAAGADDYLVKPFDFEELIARLSVQRVRRQEMAAHGDDLACGAIRLDLETRTVTNGDHRAQLTEREVELLALLMRNPGKPLSRGEIFETMWAGQGGAAINVVDVYIGYLRRKLGGDGADAPIRTIRGRGFLLAAE